MTLTIGWIGCGRHATQMLMPQLGRAGLRIGALCDVNSEALAEAASQYGVERTFSDWKDLIAVSGLDAVCMAVGPDIHHAASLSALERGLPVFMEKPPAANLSGAQDIEAAARRAGVPVYVGFMKRYSTGNRIAGNILRGGDFTDVLGITGSYMTAPTYFEGEPDYTGFYLHHCIHYMDLIPWLAGSDFEEIAVRKIERANGRLLFHLGFSCTSGTIGTIIMGTVQSRGTPMEAITIMGDHQRIEIDNVINVAWHRDPQFKAHDLNAKLSADEDTLCWTPNFTAAANEDHKGYAALLADVATGFAGGNSAAPQIKDGVRAMRWLECMIDLLQSPSQD